MTPSVSPLDVAFVFAVTGAALTPWPWLALLVAAAFMSLNYYLAERAKPE